MARFKSKLDALKKRCIVYVCKTCETQHDKNEMKLSGKPIICIECKSRREFFYFPSRAEATRYAELRLQERSGIITQLQTQVTFPIKVNSVPVTRYIADFVYYRDGRQIIEDVKGNINYLEDVFILKQKLVGAIYGIKINLIQR